MIEAVLNACSDESTAWNCAVVDDDAHADDREADERALRHGLFEALVARRE